MIYTDEYRTEFGLPDDDEIKALLKIDKQATELSIITTDLKCIFKSIERHYGTYLMATVVEYALHHRDEITEHKDN